MNTKVEQVLAEGLSAGYAGSATRQTVPRGPFTISSHENALGPGTMYVDQWIANRIGAGQEIARAGDETVTRVYGGGLVREDVLSGLGIADADVLGYLKTKLSGLAPMTRLHTDVVPPPDGDWRYEYTILKECPEIPIDVGVEQIYYKDQVVFIHVFLNIPIV